MYTCVAHLLPAVVSLYVTADLCERLHRRTESVSCDECGRLQLPPSEFFSIDKTSENTTVIKPGMLAKLRHIEFVYISKPQSVDKQATLLASCVNNFLRLALKHDDNETRLKVSPQVRLVYFRQSFLTLNDQNLVQQELLVRQRHRILPLPPQFPHHNGRNLLTDAFPNAVVVCRTREIDCLAGIEWYFSDRNFGQQANNNNNNNFVAANQQQLQQQPVSIIQILDALFNTFITQALEIVSAERAAVDKIVANLDDNGGTARRLPRGRHRQPSFLCFRVRPTIFSDEPPEFDPSSCTTLDVLLRLNSFRVLVAYVARTRFTLLSLPIGFDCQWRYVRELFNECCYEGAGGGIELVFCQKSLNRCRQISGNGPQNWWQEHGQKFCSYCPASIRPELCELFGTYRGAWTNLSSNMDEIEGNWLKKLGLVKSAGFRPLITVLDFARRELSSDKRDFPLPNAKNNLADAYCAEIVLAQRCKRKVLSYNY